MPRVCFSTGCNTGYVKQRREAIKDGKKVPSLFQAPRDIGLLDKWKRSIPRSDRELTSKDFVCALHFKTSEIETHYEVKLADGSIWKTERDRPLLKKDAVPSIFPNLPHYLSDSTSVRKPPSKRARLETLPVNLVRISSVTDENNISTISEDVVPFSYNELKKAAKSPLANSSWSTSIATDFVAFLLWNNDCVEKSIVVREDLIPKASIKGIAVSFNIQKLYCQEDLF
ncbi:uncharacterized protein [Parasteatoda tepidariorum]|uniref:uncharacterized protein n=1 Tax=Parasteatoda tepidariorum TaxID=114398 RepID=UPI0039BCCF1A